MIVFHTDLITTNPAYNDSIITYSSSTLSGVTTSEISVGSNTFTVYPIGNVFTYNFKDIAKILINQNNFNDTIIPSLPTNFIVDDSTLSLTLSASVKINTATTAETTTKNYKFLKNVEQLIGYSQKNDAVAAVRILLPTQNYIDYNLTYFEGFPCDFAVYGITSGDTFYLKNTSTYNQTNTYTATTSQVKRIYLSDGSSDSTIVNQLGLSSTMNKVELWVNGSFVANLNINKVESKCGVLLKWFNDSGSYSYHLFESIFTNNISSRKMDEINGQYGNLQSITSTSNVTGKNAAQAYKIKTNYNTFNAANIRSLTVSPKVEMFIHNEPFNQVGFAKFIGVIVNDNTLSTNNKNSNQKLELQITLPDYNTITL